MKKIENLVENKIGKMLIFAMLDLIFLAFASFFVLELRFDFGAIPSQFAQNPITAYFVDAVIMLVLFMLLKLYTSVWKYASVTELLNVIYGCFLLEIVSYLAHVALDFTVPRSFFLMRLPLMMIYGCIYYMEQQVEITCFGDKKMHLGQVLKLEIQMHPLLKVSTAYLILCL